MSHQPMRSAKAAFPPGPLLGFDPGRSKCGLALTDSSRCGVIAAAVVASDRVLEQLQAWQPPPLAGILLGNGTGSDRWQRDLASLARVLTVPEAGTTLAARGRYWELFPARGWRRLLPAGLRLPPRDIDDVVAQLLLERHLGALLPRLGSRTGGFRSGP